MDPLAAGTAIAAIAGATKVSAPIVERVFGPTADLLGDELRDWTDRRLKNIGKVIENADQKLPQSLDAAGELPPRVLARIMTEGSFCEDPMAVEYLGGVMASSRSGISRDDRGATLTALITRMSTYELRTHYILYRIARDLLIGTTAANLRVSSGRREAGRIAVPTDVYANAMDFVEQEDLGDVVLHVLPRLGQEDLIEGQWAFGTGGEMGAFLRGGLLEKHSIVFEVTLTGIQLFSWAFGYPSDPIVAFLNPVSEFDTSPPVSIPSGSEKVADLPRAEDPAKSDSVPPTSP